MDSTTRVDRIPVTIISGFLGAGKTTLLRRLLIDPQGVRYGVLVNDFGALNIDADLVVDLQPDRIALSNGCICCSLREDMAAAAISLVRSSPAPDHVLIESSGVSNPMAIAETFFSGPAAQFFQVDSIWCLVDAENFLQLDYAATELAIEQAAVADLVLLNRCDLAEEATLADITRTLLGALPAMRVSRTRFAEIPRELLAPDFDRAAPWLDRVRSAPSPVHPVPSSPTRLDQPTTPRAEAALRVSSRAWHTRSPLDRASFEAAVTGLPASVYRAKGILYFVDEPGRCGVFHLVGKRRTLAFKPSPGPATDSRLVSISIGEAALPHDTQAIDLVFSR